MSTPIRTRLSKLRDKGIDANVMVKNADSYPMVAVTSPTSRSLDKLRKFFETDYARYALYDALLLMDAELQGAVNAAAIVINETLTGFTLDVKESLEPEEQTLLDELKVFEKTILPYSYDIAYKLFLHGDAVYVTDFVKHVGLRELKWIPIQYLTVVEDRSDATRLVKPVQEANWYCLNELYGDITGDAYTELGIKRQWWKADQVAHFNWGRQEVITDNVGRKTLGIYTTPPVESLTVKLIWKYATQINDMLLREVIIPREHHMLPSAQFNPDLFQGNTQEDRIRNAQAAADAYVKAYSDKLAGRRVDRGYISLDNVLINVLEPKIQYTDPNDLLKQIDKAIYGAIGIPESVVSGAAEARGTFASEVAIGNYIMLKGEFLAKKISEKFIELAKKHLTVKFGDVYEKYYPLLGFKLQLLFFKGELARQVSILKETNCFTVTEIRDMYGYAPLTEQQKQDLPNDTGHSSTETSRETSATENRSINPDEPLTPWSRGQQQKT